MAMEQSTPTVTFHFLSTMTPPGSPTNEGSAEKRRGGRLSLSDWYGGSDDDLDQYEGDQESEHDAEDEDLFSTTASEAGEVAKCQRPRSPKKLSERNTSSLLNEKTFQYLPKIFFVGEDFDELAEDLDEPDEFDRFQELQALNETEEEAQDSSKEEARDSSKVTRRRKRSSAPGCFSTIDDVKSTIEALATHVEAAVACHKKAEELCATSSSDSGSSTIAKASDEPEESEDPLEKAKRQSNVYQYAKLILAVPDINAKTKYPKFEGGLQGHLKELLQSAHTENQKHVDVVCFVGKGKKRNSAPHPDDFATLLKKFTDRYEVRETTEGGKFFQEEEKKAKDQIVKLSRDYRKVFNKVVMEVGDDGYSPSLDGGLDAVVELLHDVRTSAWNMASFIFRRG